MSLRFDVITLFPDLVESFANESLIGRARRNDLLDVRVYQEPDLSGVYRVDPDGERVGPAPAVAGPRG